MVGQMGVADDFHGFAPLHGYIVSSPNLGMHQLQSECGLVVRYTLGRGCCYFAVQEEALNSRPRQRVHSFDDWMERHG